MTQETLFELPDPPPPKKPTGRIIYDATFSDESWGPPRIYRWTLSRRWGSGPLCLWCGCNPSDANAQRDDPTISREIGFSFRWGFGGMVKVNLEPFVSSTMKGLREWQDTDVPAVDLARGENFKRIVEAAAQADLHVAAWGDLLPAEHVTHALWWLTKERGAPVDWHCTGTNPSGSPKHTLARGKQWIPDDTQPKKWSATA